jgi:very-short-patch-repair endonuclease
VRALDTRLVASGGAAQAASPSSSLRLPSPRRGEGKGIASPAEAISGSVQAASPSSALRAPSPTRGEGKGADGARSSAPVDVWGPSPLTGEGGRRPDEGGAAIARARALRRRATPAEVRMWGILRDRRLNALKFRRQVPIGSYVADFASYDARLIIELDGLQHADSGYDKVRDACLERRGFQVLRFWNADLFLHRDQVLDTIALIAWSRVGGEDALP